MAVSLDKKPELDALVALPLLLANLEKTRFIVSMQALK
jgi:hypothetical protein